MLLLQIVIRLFYLREKRLKNPSSDWLIIEFTKVSNCLFAAGVNSTWNKNSTLTRTYYLYEVIRKFNLAVKFILRWNFNIYAGYRSVIIWPSMFLLKLCREKKIKYEKMLVLVYQVENISIGSLAHTMEVKKKINNVEFTNSSIPIL